MLGVNVDMKSSADDGDIAIGVLADHFGLATHVLRHWEAVGLLIPARSPAGHRVYRHADRYRVAAILQAKQAGLGLDDIRDIFIATSPAARRNVLERQRLRLLDQIRSTQGALALIEAGMSCQHGDLAICPRFQALLAQRAQ